MKVNNVSSFMILVNYIRNVIIINIGSIIAIHFSLLVVFYKLKNLCLLMSKYTTLLAVGHKFGNLVTL